MMEEDCYREQRMTYSDQDTAMEGERMSDGGSESNTEDEMRSS